MLSSSSLGVEAALDGQSVVVLEHTPIHAKFRWRGQWRFFGSGVGGQLLEQALKLVEGSLEAPLAFCRLLCDCTQTFPLVFVNFLW